jgi:putative heme-binding domain-containing protein
LQSRLRYFRAFDFVPSKNKSAVLLNLIKEKGATEPEIQPIALRHLDADFVKTNIEAKAILSQMMKNLKGKDYLEFADRYLLPSENGRLAQMVFENNQAQAAAAILMKNTEGVLLVKNILADTKREGDAMALMSALGRIGSKPSLEALQTVAFNKKRNPLVRKAAVEAMGHSWGGEDLILSLLKSGKIEKDYIPAAVQGVSQAWRRMVRVEAAKYLNGGSTASVGKKIPELSTLMALNGKAENGIELFKTHCANCHQVNGQGVDFGPKLSEIGSKLSREGQYMAILYPDGGISFGYEGWDIKLKDGTILRGIVTSKTETAWTIKLPDGSLQTQALSAIKSKKQLTNSLMLSGFHEAMTEQELADLVAYLMQLKRKS